MNRDHSLLMAYVCVIGLLLWATSGSAQDKVPSSRKSICELPHPESICSASNTCGSAGVPCSVDVKRTADSAAATASIADSKANAPFCVKAGTKVMWRSLSRNTGFVIDFGSSSPFGHPDAIIGGSNRSVTVVAKKTGCFKYSTGACVSGAAYGLCDSGEADLIVIGASE